MNTRAIATVAAALLLLLLGFASGRWLAPAPSHGGDPAPAAPAEREVLYWYDPMVPDQRFDKPGKSPFMDMMLVPRYADQAGAAGIAIDPQLRQSLGIRTATVERGRLEQAIRVPGTLQWDLRAERRVSARVDGIVERLHVATPFERVRAGQTLVTLLAPEWSAALAEYRSLIGAESEEGRALADAARSRLLALGMTSADLGRAPPADRVPRVLLASPIDGVVAEIDVREGERVMAGQALFRINGTGQVWLLADVPQARASLVRPGAAAAVTIASLPGEAFSGTVEALLPELDPVTRSQRARIVLDDPDARLAAGMVAEARITPVEGASHPLVPSEAVIMTGIDSRVIVAEDDRFRVVAVRLGRRAGDRVEILEGLSGGERVVVSGQFLIDSEASLSGLQQRLEPATDAHDHGAHDHDAHDPHAGHVMQADTGAAPDPHAGHRMQAAPDATDPHAGHRMPTPAKDEDPHAGHRMPAAARADDPHAAHRVPASPQADDPHAGHRKPTTTQEADAHDGRTPADDDPHARHRHPAPTEQQKTPRDDDPAPQGTTESAAAPQPPSATVT
jgi:membrane fusion protein, copper/silver efflux system